LQNVFRDEDLSMNNTTVFQSLLRAAERIARHANVPGKGEAIDLCLEDIDELSHAGRISTEQRAALRDILSGSVSTAA
jgi:hypothetical protein